MQLQLMRKNAQFVLKVSARAFNYILANAQIDELREV
jgi:hypothetical protein